MAFCPNCGSQATGSFCPNCGSALGGSAPGTGSGTTSGTTSSVPPGSSTLAAPGLTENVAGALCYLFGLITGIVFLVLAPYNQNKTVRFHAFQSIFGHIALIVLGILLSMVIGLFGILTHGFGFALLPLYGLLVLCLWLYMMYSAYNNQKIKLPIIGDLAEKQA